VVAPVWTPTPQKLLKPGNGRFRYACEAIFKINIENPKSLAQTILPLKVVQEGPYEITPNVRPVPAVNTVQSVESNEPLFLK
jgi:hypothetical protein